MTITQKILAAHAGIEKVKTGDLINAKLDRVLGNDVTTPVAINEYEKAGFDDVYDKEKICIVLDHFTPNKDIKSAAQCKKCREFAVGHEIANFFDSGEVGVEHALLPEKGLVKPGDVIIGADSHTCTYGALNAFSTGVGSTDMAAGMATGRAWFKVPAALKFNLTGKLPENTSGKDVILRIIGDIGVDGALYKSMEFGGDGVKNLSIDDRFCIANMAIEAGGKNGIFPFDDITKEYLADKNVGEYTTYSADSDDDYEKVFNYDLSQIKPVVAFPHLPENVKDFDEIKKLDKIKIDQVVIGSCTNGRLSDFRIAAKVLKGKKVAKHTRVMVIPATQKIWLECVKEGLAEIFVNAGCVFSTPTCGPCLGGHMGILAKGERAVATTNRNFVGRMGDPESEVYLSNPYIAATVAIAGYITDTVVD